MTTTFSIANAEPVEVEEGGVARFKITRDTPWGRNQLFYTTLNTHDAIDSEDYEFQSGYIVFEPGLTELFIRVPTYEDEFDEVNEMFGVQIAAPKYWTYGQRWRGASWLKIDSDHGYAVIEDKKLQVLDQPVGPVSIQQPDSLPELALIQQPASEPEPELKPELASIQQPALEPTPALELEPAPDILDTFVLEPVNPSPSGQLIKGTDRKDKLIGTKQDDILYGLDGNDKIKGKKGDDIIDAGLGMKNKVRGGRGIDTFVLNDDGMVIIKDFEVLDDFLSLDSVAGEINLQQRSSKLIVFDADGDVIAKMKGLFDVDQINFI